MPALRVQIPQVEDEEEKDEEEEEEQEEEEDYMEKIARVEERATVTRTSRLATKMLTNKISSPEMTN